MSDFLADLTRMDDFAFWMLIVLLIPSVIIVNIGLESKMFTAVFVPAMIFGALLALYLSRQLGIGFANPGQVNTVLLIGAGISAGFIVTIGIIRVLQSIQDFFVPSAQERRKDMKA